MWEVLAPGDCFTPGQVVLVVEERPRKSWGESLLKLFLQGLCFGSCLEFPSQWSTTTVHWNKPLPLQVAFCHWVYHSSRMPNISHGTFSSLVHLFPFPRGSDKIPSSLPNVGCFLDACRKKDSVSPCALLAIPMFLQPAWVRPWLCFWPLSFGNCVGSANMAPGTELGKGILRLLREPPLMRACCSVPVCVARRGLDLCFSY